MNKKTSIFLCIVACSLLFRTHHVEGNSHIRSLLDSIAGLHLMRNLAIPIATIAAGYFMMKSIMNFKVARTSEDTVEIKEPENLKIHVYTDAKVIVRPSTDDKVHVKYEYGASDRTDLAGIKRTRSFNEDSQTLSLTCFSKEPYQSWFRTALTKFFRLTPQLTMTITIMAPRECSVKVINRLSPHYTYQDITPSIDIDGMIGDIDARALGKQETADEQETTDEQETADEQEVADEGEPVDIQIKHAGEDEKNEVIKLTESQLVESSQILKQEVNHARDKKIGNIYVKTLGGKVRVHDFKGELKIDAKQGFLNKASRRRIITHPLNRIMRFICNGIAQPLPRHRPKYPSIENHNEQEKLAREFHARRFQSSERHDHINNLRTRVLKPLNLLKLPNPRIWDLIKRRTSYLKQTDFAPKSRERQDAWYSWHTGEGHIQKNSLIVEDLFYEL